MARQNSNKPTLSKSILEMKFMKKTKDRMEKQNYIREGEEYFGNQHLAKKVGHFITESSYVFCENLIDGRLSFQGENPELERLIELEQLQKNTPSIKPDKDNDTDISNEQMAKAWKSTQKINVRNFDSRVQERDDDYSVEPKRKRPKFLKPKD